MKTRPAIIRHAILLGLAAFSYQTGIGAPAAAQPQYGFRVVATLGDPLPGSAGGTFVNDFEPGSINSNGDIAFGADVSTGGEGIFLRRHGELIELARSGGTPPGGGTYGAGFLGGIAQNDQGDVVFAMLLDPPAVPFLGGNAGTYRYSHITAALSPVVIPYITPAPGGGTFQGTSFQPTINNRSDIVFGGLVRTDDGIHVNGETYIGLGVGVYRADSKGRISRLVGPGDAAPGGGTFDFAGLAWSNDAGDVAFIGHLEGEEAPIPGFPPQDFYISGIQSLYFIDAHGHLRSLAHAGDASPCGVLRQVGNPVINNRGDIAFNGDLTPPPYAMASVGVFVHSHGQVVKVACPGDEMPGGGHLLTANVAGGNVHVNNPGDLVFSGYVDEGGTLKTGIYRWSSGSLGVIARSGTVLPDVGTIEQLGSETQPSFAINNDRGQVLFQAIVTDDKGTKTVLLEATPKGQK